MVNLASISINSSWDVPNGKRRGNAAIHVRKRSIFGLRSPLKNYQISIDKNISFVENIVLNERHILSE